jgi:hypothetical protein
MKASLNCGGVCIALFLFLCPPQGLSLWTDLSLSTTFNLSQLIAAQSFGFSGHTLPLLDPDTFTLLKDTAHVTVNRG